MFKKVLNLMRNENKRPWAEVSSWALALIGGPSFLAGTYYLGASWGVAPDLIRATEEAGITMIGAVAYGVTGLMALIGWHFLAVAKRCSELLYQRHYR